MTAIGIGTQTPEQALAKLSDMTSALTPIKTEEHLARIAKAQAYMHANNIDAIYLNAGSNLTYFTGMKWYASERMVGAMLRHHLFQRHERGKRSRFSVVVPLPSVWLYEQILVQ